MVPIARNLNDSDLRSEPQIQSIYRGVVGWKDSDTHFDLGTTDNDGHTLVKVTLNAGKGAGTPVEGQAHGLQILCQSLGPLYFIPPNGTSVIVCFPEGEMDSIGAGFILGSTGQSPSIQFKGTRAVLDFGPNVDVIFKGKSVTISDHAAPARFVQVGPPPQGGPAGISMCDEKGGGMTVQAGVVALFASDGSGDAKTLIQITQDSFQAWQKDGSLLILDGGDAKMMGTNCYVTAAGVYLGAAPTIANFALWGVTGIAGVASPSVYISAI